jgi:hypothetical protein
MMARTTVITFAGLAILATGRPAAAEANALEIAPADLAEGEGFGDSACASGNLFAVGSRFDDTKGVNAGVVHVFNAATGFRVRKMFAPPTEAGPNDEFGASVAAAGTILAVGAPGEASGGSQRGAVHLFNLQTGAFLRTLRAPDRADGDHFGHALAMDGDLLVIGVPDRDENGVSNCGAIYIYNLRSNSFNPASGPARNLTTTDAAMGYSVSIEGSLVATGAPGDLVGGVAKGAIHLLDGETLEPVFNGTPADVQAGDRYGHSVVVGRGLYFASAPMHNNARGKVYSARLILPANAGSFRTGNYDGEKWGWSMSPGAQFIAIGAPGLKRNGNPSAPPAGAVLAVGYSGWMSDFLHLSDGATDDQLGHAVAVTGNTLVATGPGRDSRADDAGSAVIFSPVLAPGDFNGIADRGDAAPGAVETVFNTFDELTVSPNGYTAMRAGLVGPGSLNGKNSGVWTNGNAMSSLALALVKRTGVTLGGGRVATTFSRPVSNEDSVVGFQAMTSGQGITTANDGVYALWNGETSTFSMPLIEGETMVGNGLLGTFQTPRMNWTGLAGLAAPYTNVSGGNATPDKDSGIVQFDATGPLKTVREGADSPIANVKYGQFLPRVAHQWYDTTYAAFLQVPTTTDNVGLFILNSVDTRTLLARKGSPAPDETGASFGTFANFLGETNSTGISMFRATIVPPPAFPAQNEGLWSNRRGPVRPVLMKGKAYAGLPAGVTVKSFARYGMDADANVVVWVQLQGTGVTAANDGAILLSRYPTVAEPGVIEILLREGFPAPGCSRARVGTIQTVDVEYQGVYAILASFIVEAGGATAADNQALFLGRTTDGTAAKPSLSKPRLAMRKGMRFLRNGAQSVNSISLPGFVADATGGLDSGLSHVVRYSFPGAAASALVLFSDGSGSVLKLSTAF